MRFTKRVVLTLWIASFSSAAWVHSQQTLVVPEELVSDVIWAIAHEGCNVFRGNEMQGPGVLRSCFAEHQPTSSDSDLIRAANDTQLRQATLVALPRIVDEYTVKANFDWVMSHERQAAHFRALAEKDDIAAIRAAYKELQSHNEYAVNALSGSPDSTVKCLVFGCDPFRDWPVSSATISSQVVDDAIWDISYGNCAAFRGETLASPDILRACYVAVASMNHNEEAIDLFREAPPGAILAATRSAISYLKRTYDVRRLVGWFVVYTQQLVPFRHLVANDDFRQLRAMLEQQDTSTNAPHLWNALADSELSAIIEQRRLVITLPLRPSKGVIQSLAAILDTHSVSVDASTTVASLITQVCAPGPVSHLPERECADTVGLLLDRQGAHVTSAGNVAGRQTVDLPLIPHPGLPTFVAFRPDASPSTINTVLTSTAVPYEEPLRASLVASTSGSTLASATKTQYGVSGLRWYAAAISADKLLPGDLNMAGDPIRVGIIDAGVDTTEPLLRDFFWKLPITYPDTGWTKGSIGYDYLRNVPDPTEDQDPRIACHGTHVAGLVTARAFAQWPTAFGAIRLQNHVAIFSLKVAGAYAIYGTPDIGIPDFTVVSNALYDGISNDIHLFNASLRGPESYAVRKWIRDHQESALIVNAAGNDTLNLDTSASWSYDGSFRDRLSHLPLPDVIFVGAYNDQWKLTSNSNWGVRTVEIAAPGAGIMSTISAQRAGSYSCPAVPGNPLFGIKDGTSQAAPMVTATAAMLLAEHSSASPRRVKERILATCDHDKLRDPGKIKDNCTLNMAKALIATSDLIVLKSGTWIRGVIDRSGTVVLDEAGKRLALGDIDRVDRESPAGPFGAYVKDVGLIRVTIPTDKIAITLQHKDACPIQGADPCRIDIGDIDDVVFPWGG